MTGYITLFLDILIMGFVLLFGVKRSDDDAHFFDLTNTSTMRGFLCLYVVFCHSQTIVYDRIVDIVLSVGFVCVSFFFIVSGYGLYLSLNKKPQMIDTFWRKRLPRLLLTGWIINIFFEVMARILIHEEISVRDIVSVNGWIVWLLVCYLIFWIAVRLFKTANSRIIAMMVLLVLFSVIMWALKNKGMIVRSVWSIEAYGFLWGVLLAAYRNEFIAFARNKWMAKFCMIVGASLVFGVAYLKFKPVVFWGDYMLKLLVGIALIALALVANVRFSIGNKIAVFLGGISLEVYLMHEKVFHILQKLTGLADKNLGLYILVSWGLVIILSYVLHMVADFCVKQVYRIPLLKKGK